MTPIVPVQLAWVNPPAMFAILMSDGTIHTSNPNNRKITPTIASGTAISHYSQELLAVGTKSQEICVLDPCNAVSDCCLNFFSMPSFNTKNLAERNQQRDPAPFTDCYDSLYNCLQQERPRSSISALASPPNASDLFAASQNHLVYYPADPHKQAATLAIETKHHIVDILPQSSDKITLVTTKAVEVWSRSETTWQKQRQVKITEDQETAFTSGAVHLSQFTTTSLATSLGEVQICHLEQKAILHKQFAHEGTIRKLRTTGQNTFVSCGDDGTIKTWDVRQRGHTTTYQMGAPVQDVLHWDNRMITATTHELKVFDLRQHRELAKFE